MSSKERIEVRIQAPQNVCRHLDLFGVWVETNDGRELRNEGRDPCLEGESSCSKIGSRAGGEGKSEGGRRVNDAPVEKCESSLDVGESFHDSLFKLRDRMRVLRVDNGQSKFADLCVENKRARRDATTHRIRVLLRRVVVGVVVNMFDEEPDELGSLLVFPDPARELRQALDP